MPCSHDCASDQKLKLTVEDGLAFFRLWTMADLKEATKKFRQAAQARWSILAIVFLLWRWAIENRRYTFEAILPLSWPVLRGLMTQIDMPISKKAVSAAAFAQARRRVGMEPLLSLYRVANTTRELRFDAMCRHKGFRLWAVDGSWLNLPSRRDLEKAFGHPSSDPLQRNSYPQALLVSLDLVRLGWIADYRLDRYDSSELELAVSLTANLGEGDLLLADRLYFDTLWLRELDRRHVRFLFRLTSNRTLCFTKESQQRIESMRSQPGILDCAVELKVDTDHKGHAKCLLPCRYVEIPRQGAETLRFITNLPVDLVSAEEIGQLYTLRWGIETDFRIFKGPDHLPVVLSRKENSVRQEILARILAHNSVRYLQAEACQKSYRAEKDEEPIPPSADPESMCRYAAAE